MDKSLRVALVLETASGGSGKHVIDLANGLRSRGHEPVIIYSPRRADADFAALATAACACEPISIRMHVRPGVSQLRSLRSLHRVLKEIDPDVVHAHSSIAGVLTRVLPSVAPVVYTPHAFKSLDPTIGAPARHAVQTIEAVLARRSKFVIAVSQMEYDHALQLGVSQRRLRKVLNGIETNELLERQSARTALGLRTTGKLVGWVGRFVPQKNPLEFVRWMAATCDEVPDAEAVMVGEGSLLPAAKKEVSRLGLTSQIHFTSAPDAHRMMRAFDVLCMTSLYEAMPYTLLEALTVGTPIVTTAVGGTQETVIHGETGYVVDAETATKILPMLLTDQQMLADFGRRSLELAASMPLSKMVDQTLALYSSVARA